MRHRVRDLISNKVPSVTVWKSLVFEDDHKNWDPISQWVGLAQEPHSQWPWVPSNGKYRSKFVVPSQIMRNSPNEWKISKRDKNKQFILIKFHYFLQPHILQHRRNPPREERSVINRGFRRWHYKWYLQFHIGLTQTEWQLAYRFLLSF